MKRLWVILFITVPLFSQNKVVDIAFVLLGYSNSALYKTPQNFEPVAQKVMENFKQISFGEIDSYDIIDGGVLNVTPEHLQAAQDIRTLDAVLNDWPDDKWAWVRNGDPKNVWMTIPNEIGTPEPGKSWRSITMAAREYILRSGTNLANIEQLVRQDPPNQEADLKTKPQKHFSMWMKNTELGKKYGNDVRTKTIRMGGSPADDFLRDYIIPAAWEKKSYKTTVFIINTDVISDVTISGLMFDFEHYGIKKSDGTFPQGTCSFVGFDSDDHQYHYKHNIGTIIHEGVHGLGYLGHTRIDEDYIKDWVEAEEIQEMSVMAQASIRDKFPLSAWARYYHCNWIQAENPTDIYSGYPFIDDLTEIKGMDAIDYRDQSATKQKYIYVLKKGDKKGLYGVYIEKLNDEFWYQYRVDKLGQLKLQKLFKTLPCIDIDGNSYKSYKTVKTILKNGRFISQIDWYKEGNKKDCN